MVRVLVGTKGERRGDDVSWFEAEQEKEPVDPTLRVREGGRLGGGVGGGYQWGSGWAVGAEYEMLSGANVSVSGDPTHLEGVRTGRLNVEGGERRHGVAVRVHIPVGRRR